MILLLLLLACGEPARQVLSSKGSDTMVNLVQRWSERYVDVDPEVVVSVTGGGSGTGLKALADGTTDLAAASRPVKAGELERARGRGVTLTSTIVAYDGLAVYVHAENPVLSLSVEDLRCIWAADGACERWADLGVDWRCGADDRIIKLGRQNNSGTYEYFKELLVGREGRLTRTLDQSGTQQVVDVVGTSRCAVGYGGMGYRHPTARVACLTRDAAAGCELPTRTSVAAGSYPFSRPLYYVAREPVSASTQRFLDWVLGPDGQGLVLDAGFVPVVSAVQEAP